jgi:hypothetical protein
MKLLALAVENNPHKAKKILSLIVSNDVTVTKWLSRIH